MMERALKERIIGAVVLVIFAVLVVPIFLDGPPEEGESVTQQIVLPGQDEQETRTVVLDRERTVPIPAPSSTSERVEQVAEPEPAETRVAERREEPAPVESSPPPERDPEPEPEPTPQPPPSQTSTTGMFAVQMGSFSSRENAGRLADDLQRQGYAAFVSQVTTAGGTMHRVRIGPQKDRAAAEQMAARLLKVGHKGQVVPHP